MTAPEPLSEEDYVKQVAQQTGESVEDVRDVLDALKSMDEEEELVQRYEFDGSEHC